MLGLPPLHLQLLGALWALLSPGLRGSGIWYAGPGAISSRPAGGPAEQLEHWKDTDTSHQESCRKTQGYNISPAWPLLTLTKTKRRHMSSFHSMRILVDTVVRRLRRLGAEMS